MTKEMQKLIDEVRADIFFLKGMTAKRCKEIMAKIDEIKRLAEKGEK